MEQTRFFQSRHNCSNKPLWHVNFFFHLVQIVSSRSVSIINLRRLSSICRLLRRSADIDSLKVSAAPIIIGLTRKSTFENSPQAMFSFLGMTWFKIWMKSLKLQFLYQCLSLNGVLIIKTKVFLQLNGSRALFFIISNHKNNMFWYPTLIQSINEL